MSGLTFFAGAALLIAAVRTWRPGLPLRAAAGYLALTTVFFALPLLAGRLQVGTDIAYVSLPWSEAVAGEVEPANELLWDIPLQMLPFRSLVRARLLAGEAPLWAHELGTGEPLLGNAQSAPFAPLHLLAIALPPARALTVAAAWQMLLGLLLMHALASALGAGGPGAALAAIGFALSTFAVAWLYYPLAMTAAWLPGVLLGILALWRREPRAWVGLVACALGMAASGHPETMAQAALLGAAFTAALLVRGAPRQRLRFVGRLAAAAALAACLAAPVLGPFVESLPLGARAALLARQPRLMQPVPFEARYLAPLVSPNVFGSSLDRMWTASRRTNFNELCSDYAGLLTLALALAGALTLGGRVAALVAGGALALLAALRVSPFFEAVSLLPLVGGAPAGRFRLLWVFALALGAGLALERLAAEERPRRAAAVLLALAAGAAALLRPAPGMPGQLLPWLVAQLAAAAAAIVLLAPRLRPRFPAVVVAGAAAELFLLGVRYQPAIDPRFDLAPPPALDFLVARTNAAAAPVRVLAEDGDLHPNLGALFGLWDPRGNDAMRPAAAARVSAERLLHGLGAWDELPLTPLSDPAGVDLLAVRYLLARHQRRLPPPWRPLFDGRGGRVWENPGALPLFFMPRSVARGSTADEVFRLAVQNVDFALSAARLGTGPKSAQSGEVRAIRPRANGFDLEVRSPTGGTVASSVSWAPGWEALVDGSRGAALEVNAGFLGFEVPRGEHRVRLDYRPRGWVWGRWLAALALIAVSAASAAGVRQGRGRPLPPRRLGSPES
ncbi:MAG TPA: YfhO family protein [Thermoanaerobaculia bacterium]|nr:YfhO family protein [Thermoanaerobaculia bacterium]